MRSSDNNGWFQQLPNHAQAGYGRPLLPGPQGTGGPSRYAPQAPIEHQDTLGQLLRVIRTRWIALTTVPLVGLAAGYLTTLVLPPAYRAKASVEIQSLNENFLNTKDIEPTTNNNTSESAYLQTQVKILESSAVRQRVADRLKLAQEREFYAPRSMVDRLLGRQEVTIPTAQAAEMALAATARQVKVQSSAETRVIEVVADAPSAQLAADLANGMVDEYIKYTMEARWSAAQRTVAFLAPKLEQLRQKIDAGHYALASYVRTAGLLLTPEKSSVAEDRLRRLQDALSQAQVDRIAKQSQRGVLDANRPESYPRAMEDGALKNYQLALADLRRQLAELSASFTPEHYKVQRVQAQILEMEKALNRERSNLVARVTNDYSAAEERERILTNDYSRQEERVLDQNTKMIRYNAMQREVKADEELYDSLMQKIRAAGMGSTVTASNIRPLDVAAVPSYPAFPQPVLNSLLGSTAGMFFAIVFVLFREYSDRSVRNPVDLANSLDMPQLGVIPSGSAAIPAKSGAIGALNGQENGADSLAMVTWSQKPSLMAQSFRSTLASILFSRQGPPPRIMVVTSPNPSEGKSTVASNLAIALAEVKVNTLLIDGDMLGPTLHEVFGIENESGLAELLSMPGASPDSFVRPTAVPGLSLMTAGQPVGGTSTLLYSPWFRQLIEGLAESYDAVLIDSPPVLHVADARIMGRTADGVVLVFRAGLTDRQSTLASAQRLADDGIPIIGTVLNDFKPDSLRPYGYGKGYGYHGNRKMA